jgi:gamma-glutamylputrescine oxidase
MSLTLSYWQRLHREPEIAADAVVVGGGIIGVSTAYWLKRICPDWHVVLLEKGRLASGATGRNAGFVLQGVATDYLEDVANYGNEDARRLWQFTRENREMLETELRPRSFSFESGGSLTVAGTE